VKIPVAVALYVPKEFRDYVHKEERWSTGWNVALGKAQSEGLTRLLTSMFERVVMVDSITEGAQAGSDIKAILEPSVEEYAFVTPRDAGSPFYAVSIKYRVNVYSPDGKLADSWGFTGYGTAPSRGISSADPLAHATSLALRDAGAKLAVEFRDQAIVRGLMPGATPDAARTVPASEAAAQGQGAPEEEGEGGKESPATDPKSAAPGSSAAESAPAAPQATEQQPTAPQNPERQAPAPPPPGEPATTQPETAPGPEAAPSTEEEPENELVPQTLADLTG